MALPDEAKPTFSQLANQVVHAHKLKLLEFYRHNPLVWFSLIKQHFVLRNLTEDAVKFGHVIVSLPKEVSTLVHNNIVAPPPAAEHVRAPESLLA